MSLIFSVLLVKIILNFKKTILNVFLCSVKKNLMDNVLNVMMVIGSTQMEHTVFQKALS